MKLSSVHGNYVRYSTAVSDRVRQLGFAGLAVIWLYKVDRPGDVGPSLPDDLALPALLIVLGLALDFLHYVSATVMWGCFGRVKELRLKAQQGSAGAREFDAPRWINWPALLFFWFKIPMIVTAYWFLGRYLIEKVW